MRPWRGSDRATSCTFVTRRPECGRVGLGSWPQAASPGPAATRAALFGRTVERHDPFLAALPEHAHHPATQIDVFEAQPDELAEAKPGGIEQLEDRAVAAAERRRARRASRGDATSPPPPRCAGRRCSRFGVPTRAPGSPSISPSRRRYRPKLRSAASLRAADARELPRLWRSPRKARICRCWKSADTQCRRGGGRGAAPGTRRTASRSLSYARTVWADAFSLRCRCSRKSRTCCFIRDAPLTPSHPGAGASGPRDPARRAPRVREPTAPRCGRPSSAAACVHPRSRAAA